jgi:hypothetical protein
MERMKQTVGFWRVQKWCQSALKIDPLQASKIDPPFVVKFI